MHLRIMALAMVLTAMLMQTNQLITKRYPEPHGQVTAYNRSPVH